MSHGAHSLSARLAHVGVETWWRHCREIVIMMLGVDVFSVKRGGGINIVPDRFVCGKLDDMTLNRNTRSLESCILEGPALPWSKAEIRVL